MGRRDKSSWLPEGCVTVSADQPSSIQWLCDLEQLMGLLQPQSPALWNRLTRSSFSLRSCEPKDSVKSTVCYTLGSHECFLARDRVTAGFLHRAFRLFIVFFTACLGVGSSQDLWSGAKCVFQPLAYCCLLRRKPVCFPPALDASH